jgi:DNA-3-methyladenine glycosylase
VSARPAPTPAVAPAEPPHPGPVLGPEFFARPVARVAPELVGCRLLVGGVGGVIVETERYEEDDPASHSHRGPRGRARVMFGPPGRLYVYRSYGLHWCVNLVCEPEGCGAAVLLRALEPLWGRELMRARRAGGSGGRFAGAMPDRLLCAGPGRLTEALGIDGSLDGAPATAPPVSVHPRTGPVDVASGPRVGVSKAAERPWRFGLRGSPFLSRPLPA